MKKLAKILAIVLSLVMLFSVVPHSLAAEVSNQMITASKKVSALAPGVTETEVVSYDKNGDRVVYYVVNANIASNPDVMVKANYHDNDNTGVWGKATVVEQANAAKEKRGYNVVATTNAAYYNVSTGQPTGAFVMEGVNINGDSMGNSYEFFAIMKDGSAMIGKKGTFSQYSADVLEAVAGHLLLVWDGAVVSGLNDVNKYPRSTVGIKANGDVVLMLADGNQKPYSAGLTFAEQAQIMLDLGCVTAIELDGGGSATYAAKPEGTDEIVVRNSCCDGTVRSVSNTLMVISTAVADGTFDHASVSSAYQYYVPYSNVEFNVVGADAAGGPADVPTEGVSWRLSDDSFGTVADGVFVSTGKLGEVTVEMIYNDKVAGSATINVVNPDAIAFDADEKSIPYGKTAAMSITATYGLNNEVFMNIDALDITLSDNDAATVNGAMFTAAPESSGKTGVTVTATYKYAEIESTSVTYKFGKESAVLFDFENDDGSLWTTDFDTAKAALPDKNMIDVPNSGNGIEKGLRTDSYISEDYAKTGDSSLAVNIDYTQSESFGNWMYMYLYYLGEPVVYRDVENGILGTRLGMWMYIPEEAVGMCARLCYAFDNNGTMNGNYLYMTYQYVEKGFSKITSATIPEAGWAYVYVDFFNNGTVGCGSDYFSSLEPGAAANNKGAASDYYPAFIQFIASSSHTGCENMTLYIDDITLDYGDVAPDRDAPLISEMKVYSADGLTSAALENNTLAFNQITVNANVAEDFSHAAANATGLDLSTAQVYVDGQKVTTNVVNGVMSSDVITLPDGVHDIAFEIADKTGNYTRITKQITVNAGTDYPVVTLSGKASTDGNILCGSVYNMLLNVDQIEKIQSITTSIHLGSAHEFETEGITVPAGFTATADVDEAARVLTLKVERTGANDLTGPATLATIPARMWSWNAERTGISAKDQWDAKNGGGGCSPVLTFDYKVESGSVEYVDGYTVEENGYVAGFSNIEASLTTELNTSIGNLKTKNLYWHVHEDYSSTWTTADKAATCVEAGYTGRVTCTECNSVIDWGTAVPATGHKYDFADGVLGCINDGCEVLFTGNYEGIEYVDGVVIADGWNGNVYYKDGVKLTGMQLIDGYYYSFDENGVCEDQLKYTGLFEMDGATYYAINGELVKNRWIQVDDAWYCFRNDYKAYTGDCEISGRLYHFGETGAITEGQWFDVDGYHRYYIGPNYYRSHWGLTIKEIDGVEYGFDENGDTVKGYCYNILAAGDTKKLYRFDENGVRLEVPTEPTVILLDGEYRYIDGGELQSNLGLVCVDGDYYYVKGNGNLATGTYYINEEKSNGFGFIGYYDFDETCKMIMKDGIVDGHYYINGIMQSNLGLICIDGDYYYVKGNGNLATGNYYVSEAKSNGLGFVGYFDFDETGKMIKNGIIDGHYYVNGVLQANVGLVCVNGDYYYVKGNSNLATGRHYISEAKSNGLGFIGYYDFDENGKMIMKDGIVDGHYYVGGVLQANLGLVCIDGDYYYIKGNSNFATGRYYISDAKSNGLGYVGYYDFDENGKMIMKDGIVDGHYYVGGVLQANLGLVCIDGDYYYVKGNSNLATGRYYISEAKSNGLGFVGYYEFDETGKMIFNNGIIDGHYYVDGVVQSNLGIVEVEGDYYYVKGNTNLATGRYYVSEAKTNGYFAAGYYEFDETGKMIVA